MLQGEHGMRQVAFIFRSLQQIAIGAVLQFEGRGDFGSVRDGGMQHTEIVTAPGGTRGIGANGDAQETVSEGALPSGGTFYHRG